MPDSIRVLAGTILSNAEEVEVTPASTTAETIKQEMYFVDAVNKKNLLIHLLQDKKIESALVFTRTKHGADKVQRFLSKVHIKTEAIHGNKSQNSRQNALKNFKDGSTRVLVATDIAARGIDIDDLNLVINYEIPNIPETYVHRIGRTGRAGLDGKAVSFCDVEEHPYLRDIQKLISIQIPVVTDHPFPAENLPVESNKLSRTKIKNRDKQPRIDPGKGKRRRDTESNSERKLQTPVKQAITTKEHKIEKPIKRR
jgi:ATP-dependent RNA helicase RhlE